MPKDGLLGVLANMAREASQIVSRTITTLWSRNPTIENFDEWKTKAVQIDHIQGKNLIQQSFLGLDQWKQTPSSTDYDYELIRTRLIQLKRLRETQDWAGLMSMIRSMLVRNLGGIANPSLYKCQYGTKTLIQDHLEEMVVSLKVVAKHDSADRYLEESLRILGKSALMLSGGTPILGMYHWGVVKGLHENGTLPTIICGSQMGALVAATVCSMSDRDLEFFISDPVSSIEWEQVSRTLLLADIDTEFLGRFVRDWPNTTFLEAYQESRRVLHIVLDRVGGPPLALNYMTCPGVVIWSAVCSSISPASSLRTKTETGEIVPWNFPLQDRFSPTDFPFSQMARFNVNNFIISDPSLKSCLANLIPGSASSIGRIVSGEARHYFHQICRVLGHGSQRSDIDQDLVITLVPVPCLQDVFISLGGSCREIAAHYMKRGEMMVWSQASALHTRMYIEMTLQNLCHQPSLEKSHSLALWSGLDPALKKRPRSML